VFNIFFLKSESEFEASFSRVKVLFLEAGEFFCPGDAHGHRPLFRPRVTLLFAFPSSEVGLPHVFSKQISDLWAIAVTRPTKKSSRGQFRLGLMT
jgi:hypothetical protein